MRRALSIAVVVALAAGISSVALAQSVVGTDHDLSGGSGTTEVCVFCHTPHQATGAAGQDPLWNHTLSAVASYGVYASDTLNATPTDIGGVAAGSQAVSNLCMSCHDGTVGIGSLYNNPKSGTPSNDGTMISGSELLGTDLSDDHPINFAYDSALATADGGLVTPDSSTSVDAGGIVKLFASTVQCASCHNPHDDSNSSFLRLSNSGSALCITCHIK